MPAILPNTSTANDYPATNDPAGAQVGLNDVFASGYFVVANAGAYAQYQHGQQGQQDFSTDIFMPPATYPLVGTETDPLGGIRFKSAVAGVPAQVFGVLYKKGESALLAGSEFSSNVSSSGSITPAPTGGAMQLIQDQNLLVAAATIDFTNIPATYNHLQLLLDGRGDALAFAVGARLRFNTDAGANYDMQYAYGAGVVTGALQVLAGAQMFVGELTGANSPAGATGAADIIIFNYRGTNYHKRVRSVTGNRTDVGTTAVYTVHGNWRNTAAINQVSILPGVGNFAAGTRASLYGII